MGKHAYLIMAHNKFEQLKLLLELLDFEEHDFFIHIDKKANGFNEENLRQSVKKSRVFFVPRINVVWGGYSQIRCEILCLKTAIEVGTYDFYHLLSGSDLPLKPAKEIYSFFDNHSGHNFVELYSGANVPSDRVQFWYPFQEKIGRRKNFWGALQHVLLVIQRVLKINRMKNRKLNLGYGASWFDITEELAKYVISQEKKIKRFFCNTCCADEIFLQTLVLNSEFKETLFFNVDENQMGASGTALSIKRYIDWERGTNGGPYTFRMTDFDSLKESSSLFARKFDLDIDPVIVDNIYKDVKSKSAVL